MLRMSFTEIIEDFSQRFHGARYDNLLKLEDLHFGDNYQLQYQVNPYRTLARSKGLKNTAQVLAFTTAELGF